MVFGEFIYFLLNKFLFGADKYVISNSKEAK